MTRGATVGVGCVALLAATGCRPSDVLSVPPPAGVTVSSAYNNQSGAESLTNNGKIQIYNGFAEDFYGLVEWSGQLADEFSWIFFQGEASYANIDARYTTAAGGYYESGDQSIMLLMGGRVTLLTALSALKQYEPASGRSKIGEAYALIGYAELLVAEDYCAGTPLGHLVAGTGIQYGTPLTTDSLLGVAETDFDSAAAYAGGSDTVASLAAVGLGRTQLDRGHYALAATAVSAVPTSFVYSAESETPTSFSPPYSQNLYGGQATYSGCGFVNMADRKGTNGMNYITAGDPRVIADSTLAETCDAHYYGAPDSVWYFPLEFGTQSAFLPLATGVEARLIQAEAALQAGNVPGWTTDLNALRADAADTKVTFSPATVSLTADSTTLAGAAMRADVMFRERAFWLYGTGTRLGDMRRLIRQYGRNQNTVYPVGPYPQGHNPKLPTPLLNYGTDVNLTLPTPASGTDDPNPAFKGCLTSTKVA